MTVILILSYVATSILNIKAIAFIANKKEPTITCLSRHYQWLPRYGSSNVEFVHKAKSEITGAITHTLVTLPSHTATNESVDTFYYVLVLSGGKRNGYM